MGHPQLPATLNGMSRQFLCRGQNVIRALISGFGSPIHLVFPDECAARIREFKNAFSASNTDGRLYFAAKANKSEAFLHTAARANIGVDVSSYEEMCAALAAGVAGAKIMVTGPNKGRALHRLSIFHGATIAIDSIVELESILLAISQDHVHNKVKVVLRYKPDWEKNSRFGMNDDEITAALQIVQQQSALLTLIGFSIHLNGYEVSSRAKAGTQLISYINIARTLSLYPTLIDLGGGWPLSYVDQNNWETFIRSIDSNNFHANKHFSEFYPYHQNTSGATALFDCLTMPVIGEKSLSSLCREEDITVAIEPGRSLLDQAGMSIFKVRSVSNRPEDSYAIVTVEGQSFSISEQWFGSEFLLDPILLSNRECSSVPFLASVAGSSCLDCDMLTWRKIAFPNEPAPDDLIVYANTAGYQMDSNESSFHRVSLPKKIVCWLKNGEINWCEDTCFFQSSWAPAIDDYPARISNYIENQNRT